MDVSTPMENVKNIERIGRQIKDVGGKIEAIVVKFSSELGRQTKLDNQLKTQLEKLKRSGNQKESERKIENQKQKIINEIKADIKNFKSEIKKEIEKFPGIVNNINSCLQSI